MNQKIIMKTIKKELFTWVCKKYAMNSFMDRHLLRRKALELANMHGSNEWDIRIILTSLIEAWESIPRELIIFSLQRTHFRTADYFLQINYDFWNSLKLGILFKRFVTFDDDLSNRPTIYEKINGCRCYKIPNCKNVIEINDNLLNCKFKNINQNIKESMVQKLSNGSV
ncbi:hypothetical protein WN51_09932 [Melipona quadrifasciata]|uniref:Uncharacterized protein n=1 Tax=Melipona quadrifasciata TaxID=166423 RepID=A0A0N0U6V9_9HYME|nr:hypothetical protein WN51_09932 [Melipona quadrifasciata]